MDKTEHHNGIGTLQENSLHAELKKWLAQPGDLFEAKVDGFMIDIVRGDLLIEIQTRNFSMIKRKLARLVESHPVRLVYPIPTTKWIVRQGQDGLPVSRRRSPRRGRLEHLFVELVRIPQLIAQPNFSLQVVFVQEEEIQVDDGKGSWRRGGRSIHDRLLLEVLDSVTFYQPDDFRGLLPPTLPEPFTAKELAAALGAPLRLAQRMAYCLRQMGILVTAGKRGQAYLYQEAKSL